MNPSFYLEIFLKADNRGIMKEHQQTREELLAKVDFLQKRVDDLENMKTARHRVQEALQESLELYQTLVEISPEAIAIIDLSEQIIMVNQQALQLYGAQSLDALVGKNAVEIISPDERKRARENITRTLKEPLRDIQYKLIKNNGTCLSVEINSSVINNRQGQPVAVMLALRDVTEQKVVKESELGYRTLSEGAIFGVYIIRDNTFYYVNPALSVMFGYTADEIINNLTPALLTYPADRDNVARQLKRRFNGEASSAQYTFRGLRKDGTLIHCESLGRLIQIDGKPAIVGTLLDISESKKAEEELRYKEGFKNIISDLSAKFINLNSEDIDKGMNDALKEIGEFAGVDRSYIFLFYDSFRMVHNTHEWCALGIEPQISRLKKFPRKDFPGS